MKEIEWYIRARLDPEGRTDRVLIKQRGEYRAFVRERTCGMDVFAVHDDGTITYQCSECGRGYCVDDRPPNYCPNCGAKTIWE